MTIFHRIYKFTRFPPDIVMQLVHSVALVFLFWLKKHVS